MTNEIIEPGLNYNENSLFCDCGIFVAEDRLIDANDAYSNPENKFLIDPNCLNFPADLDFPAYFHVVVNNHRESVTQKCWGADASHIFSRTGKVNYSDPNQPTVIWEIWKAPGSGGGYNTRRVIRSNIDFSQPVNGWYKITLIGGGGGGGKGGRSGSSPAMYFGGLGGYKGGETSVLLPAGSLLGLEDGNWEHLATAITITASGGSGGGGGGCVSSGGGGGAGEVKVYYVNLSTGHNVSMTVGAGAPAQEGYSSVMEYGGDGQGPLAGRGGPGIGRGGTGAAGAANGAWQSYSIGVGDGGNGALNHSGFGGGGGGGGGGRTSYVAGRGGLGSEGASHGGDGTLDPVNNNGGHGGAGGNGAILIEYCQ